MQTQTYRSKEKKQKVQKHSIIILMSVLFDKVGIKHKFSFTHRLSKWRWNTGLAILGLA